MNVVIGIDPHKASHTAVAIDKDEDELSSVKIRATRRQVEQLVSWAEPFEKRTWAIESAGGMGYLLAQQLVARGEVVVDVPATLAARIRVLASERSNKNDPNDAHSIAVAALRAPRLRAVEEANHFEVLRLLAKRNIDIGNQRTGWFVGSTHSWPSSHLAELPRKCTFPTPMRSWPSFLLRRRPSRFASTWPSSSSTTSVGSMPS
jgi:hypothetical protein